ncbi:Ig-like domain-containing protein [Hymenobacter gelipurpurascens]|uniref:Ig-like domain-containing protein n=1 Tax=Hymenobacter gelipurpurascens TaxID=89968 RepID=UPI001FE5F415|nr:Ig-like domain-containing protein [Hymenobacter gelipurpurascens]
MVFNQDPPTLTGLTPTSGPVGSSVVIAGTGFSGTSSVTFNGTAASNFIVNSTTQITVSVPGGATTGPVLVSRGSLVSNGVPFTVTHAPIAAAQSVSINEDTPKNINLSGSDADGDALTYTIASSPAHGTLSGTGSARTYTPDANYNGPDSFTFTANDGALTSASATVSITVTAVNDAPVLANVPATASIPKQVLYTFTATASDPDGGARTFSLVNAPAGATINSTSGVFAWTPTAPQAGSTYTFSIRVSDGALSDSKPISLTVLNNSSPAAFTGFSPTAGPVGTQVNIAGSGLGAVTAVRFNGTNATFSLANSNKIVATVPAGATSGLISLSTASSTLTSSTAFTVTPAAPTISSFTPGSGPVGAQVTLTGTNLTGTTAVRFNGVSATTFTVQSATSLRMTVPAGATKGKITLTTPGGTAQSKDQFTVTNTAARLVATTPGLEQALQASPNPSPDKVYLRFALTEKQAYDLRVYDLRGALVKVLRSESAPAGQLQEVEWDASACAEGLYLIRLNSAGRSQVLKVMLSR